ncbi:MULTISPECIES: hypothetical protein [Thalassospira]|uniref:Integral membrane protein n=1 Tax=Thalassospira indica TaxID=1891279 RepID=A0ABN5NE57_9PROT|nr:hypothetical protein [Thalassospira indica]AXO14070.1 hypothetical protein DY252_07370 [Thalassospira indica]OAZ12894.1 hypothetical protein TH15_13225 [Thalassospira profundimaris]
MEGGLRETAIAHAPFFVTAPGETDVLFTIVVWFVVLAVFGAGALYLSLHALPERMAHHANHTQIQLISILTLLALFTHNNLFWLAALVIAVVQVPDFYSPLQSIAQSVKAMARNKGAVVDDSPVASEPVTTQENAKDV